MGEGGGGGTGGSAGDIEGDTWTSCDSPGTLWSIENVSGRKEEGRCRGGQGNEGGGHTGRLVLVYLTQERGFSNMQLQHLDNYLLG